MTVYIHPGFGKCASSSLQTALSYAPVSPNKRGGNLYYVCLQSDNILTGENVCTAAHNSVYGYAASSAAAELIKSSELVNSLLETFYSGLAECDDLILSCEGWINELEALSKINFFNSICKSLVFITITRAPVAWANSAYWQWGAWSKSKTRSEWLTTAQKGANWFDQLSSINIHFPHASVLSFPITASCNIMLEVYQCLGLRSSLCRNLSAIKANHSLPVEVVHLYARFPSLRSNSHDSSIDFMLSELLSERSWLSSQGTPWTLSSEEIMWLTRSLDESLHRYFLKYVDSKHRESVLSDPKWSNPEAYSFGRCFTINELASQPAFGSNFAESFIYDIVCAYIRLFKNLASPDKLKAIRQGIILSGDPNLLKLIAKRIEATLQI